MVPLPYDVPGPDNDLNETIDYHADKNKRRHPLNGIALDAGAVTAVTLPGTTIQLSNEGGIITLVNSDGLKVHGIQRRSSNVMANQALREVRETRGWANPVADHPLSTESIGGERLSQRSITVTPL